MSSFSTCGAVTLLQTFFLFLVAFGQFGDDHLVWNSISIDGITSDDVFGASVSLTDDDSLLMVGSPYALDGGAVYVFEKDSSTNEYVHTHTIVSDDASSGNMFGWFVSIDRSGINDRVAIAALGASDLTDGYGAVYIFDKDATSGDWIQTAKLSPANPSSYNGNMYIGYSISLYNNVVVIGDFAIYGAAWIYECDDNGENWSQIGDYLELENDFGYDDIFDYYGWSVSVWDDTIIVGGWVSPGYLGIYKRDDTTGTWSPYNVIESTDIGANAGIGLCVSNYNDLIVGADPYTTSSDGTVEGIGGLVVMDGNGDNYVNLLPRENIDNYNNLTDLEDRYIGIESCDVVDDIIVTASLPGYGGTGGFFSDTVIEMWVYDELTSNWDHTMETVTIDVEDGTDTSEYTCISNTCSRDLNIGGDCMAVGTVPSQEIDPTVYVVCGLKTTANPTPSPTKTPSNNPTVSPTMPTTSPTPSPSHEPTRSPTKSPTNFPSQSNTPLPTPSPTCGIYTAVDSWGKSWIEAQEYCELMYGTSLATISSYDELLLAVESLENAGLYNSDSGKKIRFWIGLNDYYDNNGDYTWIDGSTSDYRYGFVDNGDGLCTRVIWQPSVGSSWSTTDCEDNMKGYFICNDPSCS